MGVVQLESMEARLGAGIVESFRWETCQLGDLLVRISNGSSAKQFNEEVGFPISRIETIWNETIDFNRVKYVEEAEPDFIEKYRLYPNDILISHINSDSHLGKTAIFKSPSITLIHGINLLLLRLTELVSADFINYQLKYMRTRGDFINVAQRAVNQSSINQQKLKKLELSLPPLNEQRRIVEKIEELFSELDKSVEYLKTVKEQLKVYRQALLKHAFEGKLTEKWREENPDKVESADKLLARIKAERENHYKQQLKDWEQAVEEWEVGGKQGKKPGKPKKPTRLPIFCDEELEDLSKLAPGWIWVKWGELLHYEEGSFKRGPFGSSLKKSMFVERGYKVYEQYCPINDDCSFARYYITPEKFAEMQAFAVRVGDFLISCSGVTLGRITQVPEEFEEGIINQAILRVRLNNTVVLDPYFIKLFRSPFFQKKIFANSTGTAQPNVKGVNELKAIPVPCPCIGEQVEVNSILEEKLSALDSVGKEMEATLARTVAMRQSILKKAFEGKLVPQDPNDEPASDLLERIKKEKAKLNGTPVKSSTKAKSKTTRKKK